MTKNNRWIVLGCLFGFLDMVFGAFGAHVLLGRISPIMFEVWRTSARYQMYHALALLAFGLWSMSGTGVDGQQSGPQRSRPTWPGWAFSLGIVIFSGSLYVVAATGIKSIGMITPIGGLTLMAGWIGFGWAAYRSV